MLLVLAESSATGSGELEIDLKARLLRALPSLTDTRVLTEEFSFTEDVIPSGVEGDTRERGVRSFDQPETTDLIVVSKGEGELDLPWVLPGFPESFFLSS